MSVRCNYKDKRFIIISPGLVLEIAKDKVFWSNIADELEIKLADSSKLPTTCPDRSGESSAPSERVRAANGDGAG
jgi:hypothetical protein